MKIAQETGPGGNRFTGYGEGYVEVNRARHTQSLVVGSDQLLVDWPAASVQDLNADHIAALAGLAPEIVLLGTGPTFAFPEPALLAPLYKAGIGVEVMDTPAACRTFNILLAEGRNVIAALILTPSKDGAR